MLLKHRMMVHRLICDNKTREKNENYIKHNPPKKKELFPYNSIRNERPKYFFFFLRLSHGNTHFVQKVLFHSLLLPTSLLYFPLLFVPSYSRTRLKLAEIIQPREIIK